jgi:hypothetical protein
MAPVIAKAASRHGLTDRLTGRWASCGAPRDSHPLMRRGRVAGRIGLMGIIGNRDPDLPGDQHPQFGAEQGAPDAGQVQRTHIKAASNHPPGPLLERSLLLRREVGEGGISGLLKGNESGGHSWLRSGRPRYCRRPVVGCRVPGAGSRLHPRVREATTQQAGRGRPQPLGRRRANRPSGGTPVGRQGCLGGLVGPQRPGLPGQRPGQLPAVWSRGHLDQPPSPLAQLRCSRPRPNRAAQPGPQRAPHPSSPSRMTSLRAPDAIRVGRLRASQRDRRMVGVARVRDGHGEQ